MVWVMQDVNGNGEPDDEWYELRGSETGKEGTVSGYAVTYYRPAGRGMDVQWTDSEGRSGTVEYRVSFTTRISIIRLGPPILIRCAVRCSNLGIWSMTEGFGSTALTSGVMPTITEATVLRAAMQWTERDRATDSESPMPCSPTERLSN